MISLGNYYHLSAEEISCVEASSNSSNEQFPYKLVVHLKDGKSFGVNYTDKKTRDKEGDNIVRQINYARRNDYEKLYNQVYLLRDALSRMDKRQLKIWRQLRDLLGVKPVEE